MAVSEIGVPGLGGPLRRFYSIWARTGVPLLWEIYTHILLRTYKTLQAVRWQDAIIYPGDGQQSCGEASVKATGRFRV